MPDFKEHIKPGSIENRLMQAVWGTTALTLGALLLFFILSGCKDERKGGPICFPGGGSPTDTTTC